MLRRVVLFVTIAALTAVSLHPVLSNSGLVSSAPDLSPGEFWRLPWRAQAVHNVGGYGYGEGTTHSTGNDYWALDLNVPNSQYVMAVQEGQVVGVGDIAACGDDKGYGIYADIMDVGGFVHRYAHLESRFFNYGDWVEPGWAIGRSGYTGHVEPCAPSAAHVHFRISDPDNDPCTAGRCIPEPMSDQCADWSYKGYPISCTYWGEDYAFSHDPSYAGDPWKDNQHESNNAGVGDWPVTEGQPITYDTAIQARYVDEGQYHSNFSSLVVGKPVDVDGAGWYVHRWDGYAPYTGVLQGFESPPSENERGLGAIMHGDNVVHNPVDGRADIPAMWVYGEFWQAYTSRCDGVQFFYFLGYPTSEQFELEFQGQSWSWQYFQNGQIYRDPASGIVHVRDLGGQTFGSGCDDSDGDGCWDNQELGSDQTLGGRRNPQWYYDFFDVPLPPRDPGDPASTKDKVVSIGDVAGLRAKYGAVEGGGPLPNGQLYHPDYDRTLTGPDPWDTGPGDGGVFIVDIALMRVQFGHTCKRSSGQPDSPSGGGGAGASAGMMLEGGPTMGIDPDRGGPAPIGGSKTVPVGSNQQVGVHLTDRAGTTYQSYQLRIEWDAARLDLVPPASWASANRWPSPGGSGVTCAGPTLTPNPQDNSGTNRVLGGCTDNANATSSFTGEVAFLQFRCQTTGPALLHLVVTPSGTAVDTFIVDGAYANHAPGTVIDATIQCQ